MTNTAATARTGSEHDGCWKTRSASLGQPVMPPTTRWPTNTLSQGSSRPSALRTMILLMMVQDCVDTSRDRAQNAVKSWGTQEWIWLLKPYAATTTH